MQVFEEFTLEVKIKHFSVIQAVINQTKVLESAEGEFLNVSTKCTF